MVDDRGEGGTEEFKDPAIFKARRNAEALGVPGDFGEALIASSSMEDLRARSIEMRIQGAGEDQILTKTFHQLSQRDASLKSKGETALGPIARELELSKLAQEVGMAEDVSVVQWYLSQSDDPVLNFTLEFEKFLNLEQREKFTRPATEFMLNSVKEYLAS